MAGEVIAEGGWAAADLIGAGVEALADDELSWGRDVRDELIELEELRVRLEAQISRRVYALHSSSAFTEDHHRSAASWLHDKLRCSRSEGYRRVRTARALSSLDATRGSWEAGRINEEHVAAIVRLCRKDRFRSAFAQFELALLEIAESSDPDVTAEAARAWRHALDDALQDDDTSMAAGQYESRGLHLDDGLDGMMFIQGAADPFDAEILRRAIEIEYQRQHQAGDDRSPAQQRLDALIGIARQYLDGIVPKGNHEPHVMITMTETVYDGAAFGVGVTPDGRVMSRQSALRAACAGTMQRLVHADGIPLDLGRAVRNFNRSQRRTIAFRDGGCRFPGCERPPRDCEVHHITPWGPPHTGRTDISNGILLCWHHHHYVHELGWSLHIGFDDTATFTPPRGGGPLLSEPRRSPFSETPIEPDDQLRPHRKPSPHPYGYESRIRTRLDELIRLRQRTTANATRLQR
jgi:hypothetical protein